MTFVEILNLIDLKIPQNHRMRFYNWLDEQGNIHKDFLDGISALVGKLERKEIEWEAYKAECKSYCEFISKKADEYIQANGLDPLEMRRKAFLDEMERPT